MTTNLYINFLNALANLQEKAPERLPEAQQAMVAALSEALVTERRKYADKERFWAYIASIAIVGKETWPVNGLLNELAYFIENDLNVGQGQGKKIVEEINKLINRKSHNNKED